MSNANKSLAAVVITPKTHPEWFIAKFSVYFNTKNKWLCPEGMGDRLSPYVQDAICFETYGEAETAAINTPYCGGFSIFAEYAKIIKQETA